jgi:hypothetical protein
MAIVARTKVPATALGDKAGVVLWTPLANLDTGDPLELSDRADRSIQIKGTFGAAGNVLLEGSNDPVGSTATYAPLSDPQGVALNFTAAGIKAVAEACRWIRPRVTAGDGTTALSAALFVRKS